MSATWVDADSGAVEAGPTDGADLASGEAIDDVLSGLEGTIHYGKQWQRPTVW